MASEQKFIQLPNIGTCTISEAHNSRTGGGPMETVFTAGENGSKLDEITIQALMSTTPGIIRLYLQTADGTLSLISEIPVKKTDASTEAPTWSAALSSAGEGPASALPMLLPAECSILAATQKAEYFTVTAFGGDF